jgi:CysZ protein
VADHEVLVPPAPRRPGRIRDFLTGVGFLLRGVGMYARSPRLMLLGLVPALISGIALVGGLVAMFYLVDDVAAWMTPYADGWPGGIRDAVRAFVIVALVVAGLVLSVLLYTAITLTIGQPFYEAISRSVDDKMGGVNGEIDVSFWRTLPRSLVDNLRLILLTVMLGIPLFLAGLIPTVGQTVVPVIGALVGGWILALEITSVPFERRGLRFVDRRRMLRGRRSMAIGFGTATFVCFLVPLGAVLLMPAAVAGATLLSRRLFNLPDPVAQPRAIRS